MGEGLFQQDRSYRTEVVAPQGDRQGTPTVDGDGPGVMEFAQPSQTEASFVLRLAGQVRSVLAGPLPVALAVGFAGLLGLYVYSQVLSLVASLAALPTWLATIALLLLGLLVAMVAVAFGRLAIAWMRLRRNRQVRQSDLDRLNHHARIRTGCEPSQQRRHARSVLEAYVRDYPQFEIGRAAEQASAAPASNASHARTVGRCLFSEDEARRLHCVRQRLADPARVRDTREWLEIYAAEFQTVLDAAARKRVHQCAKWVGVKTALSPNSLVDTLIVAWCSMRLLRDLCVIYSVRVGGFGAAALLWQAFASAYLSGRLQDWEGHADDAMESLTDGLLPEIGSRLAARISAKAATGLANYYMVRHLGERAISLLQPLEVKQD